MDLILDVTLAPTDEAKLTPLEILEDFADASPGWHYLEDASRHYASAKGQSACILRHLALDGSTDVDLAFSERPAAEQEGSAPGVHAGSHKSALHLTIVDPQGADRNLEPKQRDAVVEHFLEHLRAHLDGRGQHADLHVERGSAESVGRGS